LLLESASKPDLLLQTTITQTLPDVVCQSEILSNTAHTAIMPYLN